MNPSANGRPAGRLLEIRVGRPQAMARPDWDHHPNRHWVSAYRKEPVLGAVRLGETGLDGDEVHDRRVHGGPTMAVLAYAAAHYPRWREELGIAEMGPGGFGENLVVDGFDESRVAIGDVWTVGTAKLCVSQPRGPCANISRRWDRKDLLARVNETHRTGWYLSVPQPGEIAAGDTIALVERPHPDWTIERILRLRAEPATDPEGVAELTRLPALTPAWRDHFARLTTRAR